MDELINNPQMIAFSNGQLRPLAKRFADLYHDTKRILAVFEALDLGTVIAKSDEVIADGATSDGRPVITAAHVQGFVAGLEQFATTLEGNDKYLLKRVLQIAPSV